jgi:DNA-binding NtrC family response regulator
VARTQSSITGLLDDALPIVRQTTGGFALVTKGPDRSASISVRDRVTIGSVAGCDLVLDDPSVSRRHLAIEIVDGIAYAIDLDSKNGSTISGVRISRAPIGFGTEIKIGRNTIKYLPDEELVEPEPFAHARFGSMVGGDKRMRQLFTMLEDVAPTNATVLIEGETGTGKELIAEEIHRNSPRRDKPFVTFDCSAVPRDLIASILFGHEEHAFTGALSARDGMFAAANGGTIFLDEIGELAIDLQPALLRVLDKRAVCRIGATSHKAVDVRVVAATHRDLRAMIAQRQFREDLYYRLAVIRIAPPPLRERGSDLTLLVEHFRLMFGGRAITPEQHERLSRHRWPGNVRELRNVIERACVLARGVEIDLERALEDRQPMGGPFKQAKHAVVEAFERDYIVDLMTRHEGNLSAAAREAELDRKYLRELVSRLLPHDVAG